MIKLQKELDSCHELSVHLTSALSVSFFYPNWSNVVRTMPANKFRTPNLLSFGKIKCSPGFIVIISDILKLFSQYFKVTSD
jgi:hypothetical protein